MTESIEEVPLGGIPLMTNVYTNNGSGWEAKIIERLPGETWENFQIRRNDALIDLNKLNQQVETLPLDEQSLVGTLPEVLKEA